MWKIENIHVHVQRFIWRKRKDIQGVRRNGRRKTANTGLNSHKMLRLVFFYVTMSILVGQIFSQDYIVRVNCLIWAVLYGAYTSIHIPGCLFNFKNKYVHLFHIKLLFHWTTTYWNKRYEVWEGGGEWNLTWNE